MRDETAVPDSIPPVVDRRGSGFRRMWRRLGTARIVTAATVIGTLAGVLSAMVVVLDHNGAFTALRASRRRRRPPRRTSPEGPSPTSRPPMKVEVIAIVPSNRLSDEYERTAATTNRLPVKSAVPAGEVLDRFTVSRAG
ncbi:hypothetical protein Acsp02_29990 [Actinoplanes sp. NBRC 103695]|nr:hypothetical protein Acsp02_29990 [Actinoplanes sp. NBRC 103695]